MKLRDSLVSSVAFSVAKDADLAWVDGVVRFSSATSKAVAGAAGGRREEGGGEERVPVLDTLPAMQVGVVWGSRR